MRAIVKSFQCDSRIGHFPTVQMELILDSTGDEYELWSKVASGMVITNIEFSDGTVPPDSKLTVIKQGRKLCLE